jgi:hypothetical protein
MEDVFQSVLLSTSAERMLQIAGSVRAYGLRSRILVGIYLPFQNLTLSNSLHSYVHMNCEGWQRGGHVLFDYANV